MILSLRLQNFKGFPSLEIDKFHGINLFLGENNTGKSGILKLLYAFSKVYREALLVRSRGSEFDFAAKLDEKLLKTFNPKLRGLAELITVGANDPLLAEIHFDEIDVLNILETQIEYRKGKKFYSLKVDDEKLIIPHENENISFSKDSLFFPPKEVLSIFHEIQYAREKALLMGFDDTYYDLVRALSRPTQQGRTHDPLAKINHQLYKMFSGHVVYDDKVQDFVFKLNKRDLSIHMAAEGVRKIGMLTHLIRNRELYPGMLLFVDEPETALHPKAIRDFINIIFDLQQAGIQVFMASHSYFVLKQLEIESIKRGVDVGCFSLLNREKGVELAQGILRDGIPENEIIEESVRLFEDSTRIRMKYGK